MGVGEREYKELMLELDPETSGKVGFQNFINDIFLAQLYLQEVNLYAILKDKEVGGNGGVTISQMQEILKTHEAFQFPNNALSATFKQLLKADIS